MGCSGLRVLRIVYILGCGSDFCFSSPSQFSSSTPPIILITTYFLDDIIITMSSSYNTVPLAQLPFSEVSFLLFLLTFFFIDLCISSFWTTVLHGVFPAFLH